MHCKIKNFFLLFILIIIVPLICSCSAPGQQGPSLNGIPFTQYERIIFDDMVYNIYAVESESYFKLDKTYSAFIYYYQEYEKKNIDNWIINYYDTNQIITINKTMDPQLLSKLYETIKPKIKEIETYTNLSFELYEDETILEKEFIIDNKNEYQNLYIIDMYIPFRIYSTYETYIIYIPVKTFLAYRNNELVTLVYDNNHIYQKDYYNFINSINKKN